MENDIGAILVGWYQENKRELPWRETTDPYLIWISEIILQQTRVIQGYNYYVRFIARFPDIPTLADAHEDEVLKYWEGLGYYSRARNLHAAARYMKTHFDGHFPQDHKDVLALKGVGEYTAAAVCSFAYKQPYAVVDGNVYRVLSRIFAIDLPIDSGKGKKYFVELAQSLLPEACPDLYNQAIMDFGAMQCLPKSPACERCPLQGKCRAYAMGNVDRFPVKTGKVVVKPRYFNYLNITCNGLALLAQRTAKDIWQNLYEFPLIETEAPLTFEELQAGEEYTRLLAGIENIRVVRAIGLPKHVLSHRVIYARFYELEVSCLTFELRERYLQVPNDRIDRYAVSRLMQLYLLQQENTQSRIPGFDLL